MNKKALVLLVPLAGLLWTCGDSGPSEPKVGPPAHLLVQAGGTEQAGVFGQPTPIAPAVLITDASSLPVPGVTVTFTIVSGGGTLSSATVVTGSTGVASVTWTLGNTFGPKLLRATAGTLGSVTFNATAIAPDAGTLAFNEADPVGDTLASTGPPLPMAIDLVSVRGDFKRDSLILALTFSAPVAPGSAAATNSVYGFVELDIDDNAGSGVDPESNSYGASANLGIEYVLDFFSGDATALVLFSLGAAVPVPAAYAGNTITARIAMSHLGNDDGNFSVVSVFGTEDRATDIAPNGGHTAVRRSLSGVTGLSSRELAPPAGVKQIRSTWRESGLFQER